MGDTWIFILMMALVYVMNNIDQLKNDGKNSRKN